MVAIDKNSTDFKLNLLSRKLSDVSSMLKDITSLVQLHMFIVSISLSKDSGLWMFCQTIACYLCCSASVGQKIQNHWLRMQICSVC